MLLLQWGGMMDTLLVNEMDLGIFEMQMVEFFLDLTEAIVVMVVAIGFAHGHGLGRGGIWKGQAGEC
jgi:hypothetical protein